MADSGKERSPRVRKEGTNKPAPKGPAAQPNRVAEARQQAAAFNRLGTCSTQGVAQGETEASRLPPLRSCSGGVHANAEGGAPELS